MGSSSRFCFTCPGSSVGGVFAPGNGRSRIRSRAVTYQSCSNGTSCSPLGTHTYGIELGLVDSVSGSTSVRQQKLLKATLNQNKQTNPPVCYLGYHIDVKANYKVFG